MSHARARISVNGVCAAGERRKFADESKVLAAAQKTPLAVVTISKPQTPDRIRVICAWLFIKYTLDSEKAKVLLGATNAHKFPVGGGINDDDRKMKSGGQNNLYLTVHETVLAKISN